MTDPLVSVPVTIRNRAQTLAQALEGVLAQNYSNLEIIFCDDGSTDDTPGVIRERYADGASSIGRQTPERERFRPALACHLVSVKWKMLGTMVPELNWEGLSREFETVRRDTPPCRCKANWRQ